MIRITKIKDNPDGSATIDINYDIRLHKIIRKHYKKKRCSKKMVGQFILEGLTNTMNRDAKQLLKEK